MAALAFAPSAQAATPEFNVMLTKIPHNVKSVYLWDYANPDEYTRIGCFEVQTGSNKDTRYKIRAGHSLTAGMNSNSTCSSYWGYKNSSKVSSGLGLTNFWFDLSVT